MNRCMHCGSENHNEASFCRQCGALTAVGVNTVECENHTDERAVGLCVVCGKPLCGDCALTVRGKIFCDTTQHQAISENWETVYETDFEFEADMIRQNLQSAGIACTVFSYREHLGTHWLPDAKLVRVMVSRHDRQRAEEFLRSLQLLDFSRGA